MASLFYIGERQISTDARTAWSAYGLTVYSFHPQGMDEAIARCRRGDLFLLDAGAVDIYSALETLSDEQCPASIVVRGAGSMASNYQWCPLPLLFVSATLNDGEIARGSLGWLRRSSVRKFVGLADVLSMASSLNLTAAFHFSKNTETIASVTMVHGKVMSASAGHHENLFALRWIDEQERLSFRMGSYVQRDNGASLDWQSILNLHVNVDDLTLRMLGESKGTLGAQIGVSSLDHPVAESTLATDSTGKYEIIWKRKNVSAEWVSKDRRIASAGKPLRVAFSTDEYRTVG